MSQYPPFQPNEFPEPTASDPGFSTSSRGELQPYSAPAPFAHYSAPMPGPMQPPPYMQPVFIMPPALKDTAIAYLLAIFLGGFGAHNFYLGRTGAAVSQLIMWIVAMFTWWIGIGLMIYLALGIWLIVDLCTIPGTIRGINEQRMREYNARNGHFQRPGYRPY